MMNIITENLPLTRTLGMQWCVETDCFKFKIEATSGPVTRRHILSVIASIYDPLGLVSPFVLLGRQILQDIYCDGHVWDDSLDEETEAGWCQWREQLVQLTALNIPHCHKHNLNEEVKVEIHHYSDASSKWFGYCSYLRFIDSNATVYTTLVMSKARVAPTKHIRIPRLELTAAVLSAHMSKFLTKELDYRNVKHFYWTDSKVVRAYLRNKSRRFHVYVANRVQQIHDNTLVEDWG